MFWIIAYLVAACSANIVVAIFGYNALPFTALLLIPFDLTARDVLHDRWTGQWFMPRMFGLVLCGSVLSWLFCNDAQRVAIASAISFLLAGGTDTIVYSIMNKQPRSYRMITSNTLSAVVDSTCFPLIAFGTISVQLQLAQVLLKVLGGVLFVVALQSLRGKHAGNQNI